jgi:predicted MFS family arabinose efflux permease
MAIFATQIFVLGEGGQLSLGIMYSAFGFGAILGPLMLNRFHRGAVAQLRRLIGIGYVAIVLGWLVLASADALVVVCIALILRAVGGSVNWTYSTVSIQKSVPDAYLGRVFSLDMAGFYLATVISTIVHGSLVDTIGSENVRVIALGTAVVSIIPLVVWAAVVRRLEIYERQTIAPTVGEL